MKKSHTPQKNWLVLLAMLFGITSIRAQNDLPNPSANVQTIAAGAWVVAMDNTYQQDSSGLFNLKAYGLINSLLWNNIHPLWAIKAGKGIDSADFRTFTTKVFPSIDTVTYGLVAGANFETSPLSPNWAYSGSGGTNTTANKYNGGKSWRMGKNQTITMTNTSISEYINVTLSVAFASNGNVPVTGDLFMDISYDNGASWTGTGSVKLAAGDGSTAFNINTTNGNTVASNPYTVNIPAGTTQINVRFRTTNTGTWPGSSYYYVDDIKLYGQLKRSFAAGPFIIQPADTAAARTIINSYNAFRGSGSKVNVYKLTNATNIDIRYTLVHKPLIAVYDDGGNANIHTTYLTNAGITSTYYDTLGSGHMIDSLSCYTFACTPHWVVGSYSHSDSIRMTGLAAFMRNGGNFLAECEGASSIEGFGNHYMTTTGINNFNKSVTTVLYMNMDLPVMQFHGGLIPQGGSLQNWNLPGGGAWKYPRYKGVCFYNTDTANVVNVTKYINPNSVGGNMVYLGGHQYDNASNGDINGQRVFLNAVMMPARNLATNCNPTSNSPVCIGDTIKLYSNPSYNGFTWSWTGPNSYSSSSQNPAIANASTAKAGTYTLSISTNDHSCSYSFSTAVSVPTKPSFTVNGTTVICQDDSTQLSLSSNTGLSTANWYKVTGGGCTPNSTYVGSGLSIYVSPAATTKYIAVGITSTGSCLDTATACAIVTVDTKPVISSASSTSTPVCYKAGVSATITAGSGGSGCSETYQWRQDAGTWQTYTSGTIVGTTAHDSIEIKATRNCTVNGCFGKVVRSRWLVAAPIDTAITVTQANCGDASGGYIAQLSGHNPAPGTGLWTKVSGSGTVVSPTSYIASITGLSSTGGTTVVKWVVTNIYGCKDSTSRSITPHTIDSTHVAGSGSNMCLSCPVKNGNSYYYYDLNGNIMGILTDINDAAALGNTNFCANLNYNPANGNPTAANVPTEPRYGMPYLPRVWNVDADSNASYNLTVYITDAELQALITASQNSYFPFNDISQLYVTSYPSGASPSSPDTAGGIFIAPTYSRVGSGWTLTFPATGDRTFYVHPVTYPYGMLPVELVNLSATPLESTILVKWSTASEINNNYFNIERSTDGKNFTQIGSVKGGGNTHELRQYSFEDKNAESNQLYYYRLKQVDFNSTFKMSNMVSAFIKMSSNYITGELMPNPTADYTSVQISASGNVSVKVTILSLDGRIMKEGIYPLTNGENQIDFNVQELDAGTYLCRFELPDGMLMKKLVKSK